MPNIAFVSMPFGDNPDSPENEWTKLFDYGLKPLEKKIDSLAGNIEHVPIKLWRADKAWESLNLKTNVMRGIENSTFIICVLTTGVSDGSSGLRLSNPNVLWELGYAEALEKPIVVLADDPSLSQLPILTGSPNVCTYDHTVVKESKVKNAKDSLKHIAKNLVPYIQIASQEAQKGYRSGKKTNAIAYPKRDSINLVEMISNATNQVDILTTNSSYFLFDKLKGNKNPFHEALSNGASVRIVTMDPESVIAEYRAKQLMKEQDIPGYRKELRDGIIELFQYFRNYEQFHLHIYNDLPLQITFRIDDTIITSVVTRGERARKRLQIQFSLYDEGVTESFVSHFQSMFETSKDVSGLRWVTEHYNKNLEPICAENTDLKAKQPTKSSSGRKKVRC